MNRFFILLFTIISFMLLGCGGGSSSSTTTTQKNFKLILESTEPLAGYEVHLKFSKDTSTQQDVVLDNAFLGSTGRTVTSLEAKVTPSKKHLVFGGFTVGSQEAVTGRFTVLQFKSKDTLSQISIAEKTCLDRNAREIVCDVEIVEGV